jgi:hypothetical protein
MFFLGEIEHRFGSVDSFSRHYRVIAQSKDSAWRILDKLASAGSLSPYPSPEQHVKGSYVGDAGHLVIVDSIVEVDAQTFHSKALERFPLHADGSAEPPEDFPEYVKEVSGYLGRSLATRGAEVGQSVLLHAVAAAIGETDWQKLRTKFKGQRDVSAVTSSLSPRSAVLVGGRNADSVYAECRECEDCGHIGINDSHDSDAACGYSCGWSGPSPKEDKCPGCGRENVMSLACPKCSGYYRLVAGTVLPVHATLSHADVTNDGEPEVAVVDENDDGLFVDIVYGEDGSPLKRGDKLYTRPQGSGVAVVLGDAQILERARHHAIDHEHWSPNRCLAFAHDILRTSEKAVQQIQTELERLYHQAEGAYSLGGERHMKVTLADIAERLLNLQSAMVKAPLEPRIKSQPQVAEDFFAAGKRIAAKATPGARTVVLADPVVSAGNSGYLAGFVSTHVRRPTFLFYTVGSEGSLYGTGRTVVDFDLCAAIKRVKALRPEIFVKDGGHAKAYSLTLKAGTLETFAQAFEEVARDMLTNR